MVLLTKLDNSKILVSLETVKYIEKSPDSIILFTNGESVIVRETLEEIQQAVVKLKASVIEEAQVNKG